MQKTLGGLELEAVGLDPGAGEDLKAPVYEIRLAELIGADVHRQGELLHFRLSCPDG